MAASDSEADDAARGLAAALKRARHRRLDRGADAGAWDNRLYSGSTWSLWRVAREPTAALSRGLVLDAGAGRGGWARIITTGGATRETLDVAAYGDTTPDWTADLCAMPEVPSDRFDAVVCHQVLEHVPHPAAALGEIARVTRPGGALVLSVPHLSRLHEEPHDYFRYTRHGLGVLMRDAGFEDVEITPYGGLLSFVHHQFATVALGLAGVARPLEAAMTALNAPLTVAAVLLDSAIDRRGLMATGYVVTARKPGAGA